MGSLNWFLFFSSKGWGFVSFSENLLKYPLLAVNKSFMEIIFFYESSKVALTGELVARSSTKMIFFILLLFFCTDNWLLIRIGPGFLGSAPKFTSSSFFFGRIYAFLFISVSFSRTFISSILTFLLLSFSVQGISQTMGIASFFWDGSPLGSQRWEPHGILTMGYSPVGADSP